MDETKQEEKQEEQAEWREPAGFKVTDEEIEIALKKVLQGFGW